MLPIHEDDISVFADLGTPFRSDVNPAGDITFSFIVNAKKATLEIPASSPQPIKLTVADDEQLFPNPKALLASESFGDLRRWASNQATYLDGQLSKDMIELKGAFRIDGDEEKSNKITFDELDDALYENNKCRLQVLIMDGPAGIGKTTQISRLAHQRAKSFGKKNYRLVLHVESTGRVLQNLDDLIAGSLQKIRARPTFDQLRVLVRHGLVTLAIDGFDELADPNGYQLAWSQLANLLSDVTGSGQVFLSGRETFVSVARMKSALPILESESVQIYQYRLFEVDRRDATEWLLSQGMPKELVNSDKLQEIISPGSYALRPFFLRTIADCDIANKIIDDNSIDILSMLIDSLIERETAKFGEEISKRVSKDRLSAYLRTLCEELARDMADNQSEALPGQTVMWSAELCIPTGLDRDLAATLIHRSAVLPFLTNDKAKNAIKFAHRQYLVFFLGANAINTVSKGEIPKYLRRNILGSEFLEAFPKVVRNLPRDIAAKFVREAQAQIPLLSTMDRSCGNVAALLLSAACEVPTANKIVLRQVSIDEVCLQGDAPEAELIGVTISVLHAKNTNLTRVSFSEDSHIVSLQMDSLTNLPDDFPLPSWVEDEAATYKTPQDIQARVRNAGETPTSMAHVFPFDQSLLNRILRYRPFWLRNDVENVDHAGRHIVDHPEWPEASNWLRQNGFLRVDERYPASGRPAEFIHFRQEELRERFL